MATVFSWKISQLERFTSNGMVQTVHYTVDAKDEAYTAGAYGSIGLEPVDPESMVPFADLTEEQVVQWVKDRLGEETVKSVEQTLQSQLDEQHAPSKATGLPW